MLGVDAPVSALIVRDMLLKSLFAFFLGWPTYLGVRRALRPALVEEPSSPAAGSRLCWGPEAACTCAPTNAAPR